MKTNAETVSDLTLQFAEAEFLPQDSRELPRLVIEWAEIFEARNAGREWDGEYLEEIETFFRAQYAAWAARPGDPIRHNHMLSARHP
jgi:hypothetical protein